MGAFLVTKIANEEDIGERMAGLGIEEEENEAFVLDGDIDEDSNRYELCLVGRLLTEKSINTRVMKSKCYIFDDVTGI